MDAHESGSGVDSTKSAMMEKDRQQLQLEQQLLLLLLINSLRREDIDGKDEYFSKQGVSSDIISRELSNIAQHMFDGQLLDILLDTKEARRADHNIAAKQNCSIAAKKRSRRNKATQLSWVGGAGIFSQILVMAFSSITTLIVTLSVIHQSVNGSSEGGAPPSLPPTSSQPLRYYSRAEDFVINNDNVADIGIDSPSISVVPPPILSPTVVASVSSNNRFQLERILNEEIVSGEKESLKMVYNMTNGQNWSDSAGWMNETISHCQWHGVSCNDDGFVTKIDLRENNLEGGIFGDENNGLADLLSLKSLDLADNKLSGTINYLSLFDLDKLSHFDVSGNLLSGEVNTMSTTSSNFSNNRFTSIKGSFQTLRSFDVSNNDIKIGATDLFENMPNDIEQFIASHNNIHGKLPESLNNLQNLRRFDLSFNDLSGELPIFESSRFSLQELDVSNQKTGFAGSIPEELWRLQFLKTLNLAGNKLAGRIPPDIVNMAVLGRLDLSNNMLSDQIPPQIGQLDGTLNYLNLANNSFTERIPSQLGELESASVHLKDNAFDINNTSPVSLCTLRVVKYFDLADDTQFCPIERNALSNLYDSAKGAEWTDATMWDDEYASHCEWHGVKCDVYGQVTELNLTNNGLSGRLSPSIGKFTSLKVLDLSDNDIKGSIPSEIGLLSKLEYLRLSYNAFTGAAPEELTNLTKLELLQLQSNRVTKLPSISKFKEKYIESTFVTDCGVPSAFQEALKCENCTMCCNAHEDCYPQGTTFVKSWELNYFSLASALLAGFAFLSCVAVLLLYFCRKRRRQSLMMTRSMVGRRMLEDEKYAMRRIGKDSVYSYFVTDMMFGWLIAFCTLIVQAGILVFFVNASEVDLQNDAIDIEFTWKCPRDSDVCSDKSDLENAGWAIFVVLMVTFLAKDMINGSKLIYHSSSRRHPFRARMRYFVGGLGLCLITLFSLYVSTIYNNAIATSNTEIVVNAVIVLFINDIDEWIFAAIDATNENWTKHTEVEEFEDLIAQKEKDERNEDGAEDLNEIATQNEQIASLQQRLESQEEELKKMTGLVEQMIQLPSVTFDSIVTEYNGSWNPN